MTRQLEDLQELSRQLDLSPSTVRRRIRTRAEMFPQPVQRRGKMLFVVEDRLAYVAHLVEQRDVELCAQRAPAEPLEDRPAA